MKIESCYCYGTRVNIDMIELLVLGEMMRDIERQSNANNRILQQK